MLNITAMCERKRVEVTPNSIEALEADRKALIGLAEGFGRSEWDAPSGCPGWRVQDVVAHMGALFWLIVDPSVLPDPAGRDTEDAQELYVSSRRDWSPDRVLDDYRDVSSKALDTLAGLAGQAFEVPLGDLGTYPASMIPSAYAFDHFTHIRADLFEPRGPLGSRQGLASPAVDETRMAATLDWIEVALPQQNADPVGKLPGRVELVVEGPAPRTISAGDGEVCARVLSQAFPFVRWITQRGTWDELGVEASGSQPALEMVRRLKVF